MHRHEQPGKTGLGLGLRQRDKLWWGVPGKDACTSVWPENKDRQEGVVHLFPFQRSFSYDLTSFPKVPPPEGLAGAHQDSQASDKHEDMMSDLQVRDVITCR